MIIIKSTFNNLQTKMGRWLSGRAFTRESRDRGFEPGPGQNLINICYSLPKAGFCRPGAAFSKILKSNLGYKNFLGWRRNSQKFLAQSKDMKYLRKLKLAAMVTLEHQILRKILGI